MRYVLLFMLLTTPCYAQDLFGGNFGDLPANQAYLIWVEDSAGYFGDVASPPSVESALEELGASRVIVTAFTDGSVIFSEDGDLAEDNSNLFWDNTNDELEISDIVLKSPNVPSSPNATGVTGEMAYDTNYWYACINTNTWRRDAWETWTVIAAPDIDFTYENSIIINLENDLGMILE